MQLLVSWCIRAHLDKEGSPNRQIPHLEELIVILRVYGPALVGSPAHASASAAAAAALPVNMRETLSSCRAAVYFKASTMQSCEKQRMLFGGQCRCVWAPLVPKLLSTHMHCACYRPAQSMWLPAECGSSAGRAQQHYVKLSGWLCTATPGGKWVALLVLEVLPAH